MGDLSASLRLETVYTDKALSSMEWGGGDYIVGPYTCTETTALNGYINICILWLEFSNWSPMYSLG